MTIDELKSLVYKGDPIAVPERPYRIDNNIMHIPGIDKDGHYADDLQIAIEYDQYHLFYKAPNEVYWTEGGYWDTYEDMVSFIYTL